MINNLSQKKYITALGFFDGLHRAHRQVLDGVLENACSDFIPSVLLFDEHPRKAITGKDVPGLIQKSKRDEILRSLGIQPLFISFSEIKDMTPEEFVDKILVERFSVGAVVCGYNYNFGKNASGDAALLEKLCSERGIKVSVCPRYTYLDDGISSTRIRKCIEEGKIEEANEMLGFCFSFISDVFSGDKRGRLLGTPTVNQLIPEELIVPAFGVYASMVRFDGQEYAGVTNIGSRPTFDGESVRSETYILGYSGDLYGKTVEISLHKFIREERKFPDGDALKEQISLDIRSVKDYFEK